jgi:hypothetical protein
MSGRDGRQQNVVLGIVRVARGRADGLACFGATPQAFLASLAPLIAFPLVGAGLSFVAEGPRKALTGLAVTICALLTPAVISYELARLWKRGEAWLRFATAFNWCEWILPVLACMVMLPLGVAMDAGLSERVASTLLVLALVGYGLWLHWFLARKCLGLSVLRAVLLVILVNAGTGLTVLAPHLLAVEIT